jgi:hypothetical protein
LETYASYYERISKFDYSHIHREVIHQWIFPHFNESNSIKNYAWIDLSKVKFDCIEFPISFFQKLNIIKDYEKMITEYTIYKIKPWNKQFWKTNGTWEVPPIIIDVKSFSHNKPAEAELNGCYQLVEGHNRLGALLSLSKTSQVEILPNHFVYLLCYDSESNKGK